jgi:predicted ATPase/DNA-binding CsgD family transcriptional regulator
MQAAACATPATGMHGFSPALTSFVGRSAEVAEVAGLLGEYRLVTVTGPGGVGKTRLAAEVARAVAGQFADGAWLVDLAAVPEPALLQAAVATALGIQQAPGPSLLEALIAVLAWQQLLLVLDNCEHVLAEVARLCGALLAAADDVRILATSREPVAVAGEARYRLGPLALAAPGDTQAAGSEAETLFADRVRQADPRFTLDEESMPVMARIVARLDGVPLAIELAAARVEALGMAQLLDRLDDRLALLDGGDRLAPDRLRSLAGAVDWSYQLLSDAGRRVFRALSVFPGPFTLDAAEAVAPPDAGPVVLRLVDCSLLTPPRPGPDGRARYMMLETLRAFAAARLTEAGEHDAAGSALAAYALSVAEQAAAALETSTGELAGLRWLDAEDATVHHALSWALNHDPATALRLAIALARWWSQRGRAAVGYDLLTAAAVHAERGSPGWLTAQVLLGELCVSTSPDYHRPLAHFTAACGAPADPEPSQHLARALAGVARCQANLGLLNEAAATAARAVDIARHTRDPAAEMLALYAQSAAAGYGDDVQTDLSCMRQAGDIDPAAVPGQIARRCIYGLAIALYEVSELDAAWRHGHHGLELARQAADEKDQADFLRLLAEIHLDAGRHREAWEQLRAAIELESRTGTHIALIDSLDIAGSLCAAGWRWDDAVTIWAAHAACLRDYGLIDVPHDARRRQEPLARARQELGGERAQEAERRGAAMSLATAAEYALLLAAGDPAASAAPPELSQVSPREQELVTLVARGSTNAQIAAQLHISVRTVGSHLDRIRDKTGCRRRADLTRLALQAGLV